jgi:hypothetical protein
MPEPSARRVVTAGRTCLEVVMRMLLKAVFDTEATNELFRSGEVSAALARLQEVLQPEAYYGFVEDGQRTSIYVFDMADSSQIPVIAEPMFQQGNARVTLTPCMNLEDLKNGIEEATARMQAMQGQSAQ